MGINAGLNAAVLAVRILALSDPEIEARYQEYAKTLSAKVEKADTELAALSDYKFKV